MKKKINNISKYIKVGDKVRYKGQIIEVLRFNMLDKMYCLKDTDQLYKNDKLFAEKINGEWIIYDKEN